MTDIKKIELYAEKCYADANCTYGDGGSYMIHIRMVVDFLFKYGDGNVYYPYLLLIFC